MNNTFYFLRHGKTKVDSAVPISQWVLSEEGQKQVQSLAESSVFDDVDIIIASGEMKAYQTAKPIADKLGKKVIQFAELSELDRDKGGFMEAEEYEATVEEALRNRALSVKKWESAQSALERFSQKVGEIDAQYEGKKILVVGHGYTINLYFAQLLGVLDQVYERLNTNTFCDWGIVRNGEVIKDVAN